MGKFKLYNEQQIPIYEKTHCKHHHGLAHCVQSATSVHTAIIGEIDAMPEATAPDEENAARDTFSPCWMLNPEYHGKGYAYEAAHAFFDYLFNEKGARRIYAYTEDYNVSSQKLCEKLGMRREGFYLEFISFVNDEDGNPIYENTYEYAILKKEWEQNKK